MNRKMGIALATNESVSQNPYIPNFTIKIVHQDISIRGSLQLNSRRKQKFVKKNKQFLDKR